jgi:hypothetical protein
MAQMFDNSHSQLKNWRWDNHCAFGDQVNRSNRLLTGQEWLEAMASISLGLVPIMAWEEFS